MHLKTLGHPALYAPDGSPLPGLRRKDLALLVYLAVEGTPAHARGRLATLLWGDSTEERARHSLTQALGRVARLLPPGTLSAEKDAVRWRPGLPCDAVTLLRGGLAPGDVDDAFGLFAGPFLEGFDAGAGASDFRDWADRRGMEVRNAALRLLERAGEEAAAAGGWDRALRLAERAVEIDPVWEQGHRRLMRALAARGERNRALRHYQAFAAWLAQEVGGRPDPGTQALADQLRSGLALVEDGDPSRPPPAGVDPPEAASADGAPGVVGAQVPAADAADMGDAHPSGTAPPSADAPSGAPSARPPAAEATEAHSAPAAAPRSSAPSRAARIGWIMLLAVTLILQLLLLACWLLS